jgi:ABC-type nitrate/sulfonate/bicarbonate transport system substrate-binding protein
MVKSIVSLLVVVSFLAYLASPASAAQQEVKIAYAAIGSVMAGFWMAKEIGAFEKYGLQTELVYIPSGPLAVSALIAGHLDLAVAASNAVISAIDKGAPVVAVGTVTNRPTMSFWVQPDISSPEQLVGKSMGITRFGSTGHFLTNLVLAKFGLQEKVVLQQFGSGPDADNAFRARLISGRVTALKPSPQARNLGHLADLNIPYSMDLIVMSREYQKKYPAVANAMLMAYIEGVAVLKSSKQQALKMIGKYSRQRADAREEIYQEAVKYLLKNPRIEPVLIQTVLDWMGKPDTPVQKFFDNSIVDRLAQEGFFQKLYGEER